MRAWFRRTAEIHAELAAVAPIDRWWWLLAGGVAFAEPRGRDEVYLACDTEPAGDTFMGFRAPPPRDLVADAIARARAARAALLALDGTLPGQPLAVVTDRRRAQGTAPCTLEVAAFAIGDTCVVARLDDPTLAQQLAHVLAGGLPAAWTGVPPFVCVSIGDEPIETARHGHRRAWTTVGGPWLGLSRAGELAIVSTCHLVVDGYGHALIAGAIAAAMVTGSAIGPVAPPLAAVRDAVPLTISWRLLDRPPPRVIPLAYDVGCLLHRDAGDRTARFSPTIQIPVARGDRTDPLRLRRRVVSATTSVRFADGVPEPYVAFEARVREVLAREARDAGLVSRLLAAARGTPVPLAWKRASIGAKRPPWLDRIASLIGGRALVSRISVAEPIPPMCAVSSPSRLATSADPVGGCVLTVVDDGTRGAITLSGTGVVARPAVLDEILARVAPDDGRHMTSNLS